MLNVFNEVLKWNEKCAADAVAKFVRYLELPDSLNAVGIRDEDTFQKIAELTMTDVWGGGTRQIDTKEEIQEILELARG